MQCFTLHTQQTLDSIRKVKYPMFLSFFKNLSYTIFSPCQSHSPFHKAFKSSSSQNTQKNQTNQTNKQKRAGSNLILKNLKD